MKKNKQSAYNADSISHLKGYEHVRLRAGMYVGSTEELSGLHHILQEAIDNAVDEAQAGFCDKISVILHADNSATVIDSGRGIPVDIHKESGISAATLVLTELNAGGKFDDKSYIHSGGLHGVGISVSNFLSLWLELEIYRDGRIYSQRFETGKPVADISSVKDTIKRTGTKITFLPDSSIFKITKFSYTDIASRLKELAFLNRKLSITLSDERGKSPVSETFCYTNGIVEHMISLAVNKQALCKDPIYVKKVVDNVHVEACLQWIGDSYSEDVLCYTNSIRNPDGGVHLTGLRNAVTRSINKYVEDEKLFKNETLSGDDAREGLLAIVAIKLRDPKFSSQTKDKLVSSAVRPIVEGVIADALLEFLQKHKDEAKAIAEKCILSAKARIAARQAKENVRRKSPLDSTRLPGKLADCSEKDPKLCELFIVEGEGGGGNCKSARSRATQAILPLRGKVLNVEKSDNEKMNANKELSNIAAALGAGIGKAFDISKLRYHKVIILADGDCLHPDTDIVVDGNIKKISDVNIGDSVLTQDNSYKKVINKTLKTHTKCVELTINGNIITCSENHKWPIVRDGKVIIVRARDVKKTDFFLLKI